MIAYDINILIPSFDKMFIARTEIHPSLLGADIWTSVYMYGEQSIFGVHTVCQVVHVYSRN